MIGRPIAISEPNATSSTTIATTMPTSSLAGIERVGEPAARELDVDAGVAQRLRELLDVVGGLGGVVAVAVRGRDRDDRDVPARSTTTGGSTEITPSAVRDLAAGTRRSRAGRCRMSAKTIRASSPCCCGKSRASESYAACESVCGSRPVFA